MIETLWTAIGDGGHAVSLTLIIGILYAAIWFLLGGLWAIRQVRRGRLLIPVTVHTVRRHQPTK